MSVLERLTEGIVNRDLSREGTALLSKWEKTGLLEGLGNDRHRQSMAVLLENQAKELLREASTMSGGDVEGFSSVAFPIVRRVFGGLIANDLVSVQPMSLPSGLIFFLDFTLTDNRLSMDKDDSVYGGGVVAAQITGGVSLSGENAEESFYALNNGYSSPTGSATLTAPVITARGTVGDQTTWIATDTGTTAYPNGDELVRFDPDLLGKHVAVGTVLLSEFTSTDGAGAVTQLNLRDFVTVTLAKSDAALGCSQARRLTRLDPNDSDKLMVVGVSTTSAAHAAAQLKLGVKAEFVISDSFGAGGNGGLGSVIGQPHWELESQTAIPEIDIKVDSIPVTAMTKKLKAKWTPELAQDLNAYHNMDAEVELTSILSEHIALEIDREILEDLLKGATGATLYWSRRPGKFVNRTTGATAGADADFTGNVSEWYETLVETINDVSAAIHRKTLRGGANFLVVSPEVANLLEFTAGFRGSVTHDDDRGTVGTMKVGSLSKKFDVYVDAYFPRNVVLVGRKGSSFLESGYVYAPYVPLQMTPTIFGTEDFVPRKGVMTRYAKKMVRPDLYGVVVITDILG